MIPAFNRSLKTGTTHPEPPATDSDSSLNVTVVFTSVEATIAALEKAGSLAKSLGARIILIVPQIVPFPLPLSSPPVLLEFQENRFREIAARSPVDVRVQLYLCRDGLETLQKVLGASSLVVVGGRKRWWPTLAGRLARKLQTAGHEVIFAEER